jgi:hypothetical protein
MSRLGNGPSLVAPEGTERIATAESAFPAALNRYTCTGATYLHSRHGINDPDGDHIVIPLEWTVVDLLREAAKVLANRVEGGRPPTREQYRLAREAWAEIGIRLDQLEEGLR